MSMTFISFNLKTQWALSIHVACANMCKINNYQTLTVNLFLLVPFQTVVAHEIAHALGVIHEHQRSDRDQFINVVQDNLYMSSSPLFTTYLPDIATTLDIPYDYASVMHYFAQVRVLG